MEETLEKFKDLLKYTLAENHRIDKSSLLENFSIINDYSAEEVYEELKNLIENLLVSKESLKSTQKFSKIPSHIHFTDLPTERNLLLRQNLKFQMREIQNKYISKVSKLLKVNPIKITPSPIKYLAKPHERKSSSFKSLNRRHPGTVRDYDDYKKVLISELTNKISKIPQPVKKKVTHFRSPSEFILC